MADDVPATIQIIAGDGSTFFENAIEAIGDGSLTPQIAIRTLQGDIVGSAKPLPVADAIAQGTLSTLATATGQASASTILSNILTKLGAVVIAAGSAIIGKVGIDQTTPGTTNGVQIITALPPGTNTIGSVLVNNSATVGDGTITTGGAAQSLFSGIAPVNGWKVANPHPTADLWVADNGVPAAANTYYRVFANGGQYSTENGEKPVGVLTIIGAVTGQSFVARRW